MNHENPTDKQRAAHYKKHLGELVAANYAAMAEVDRLMRQPSTPERGRAIAKVMNALDFATDQAWHFGLDQALGTKKHKRMKGGA